MKKRPFHVVILSKIEEKIPNILSSRGAENEMRELGNILYCSILPDKVKEEVVISIEGFAEKLSPDGDEKRARLYLENLVQRLKCAS